MRGFVGRAGQRRMCESTTASTFIAQAANTIDVISAVASTKVWVFARDKAAEVVGSRTPVFGRGWCDRDPSFSLLSTSAHMQGWLYA